MTLGGQPPREGSGLGDSGFRILSNSSWVRWSGTDHPPTVLSIYSLKVGGKSCLPGVSYMYRQRFSRFKSREASLLKNRSFGLGVVAEIVS